MRRIMYLVSASAVLLAWGGMARSGEDDGRAIVNKAIKAGGGEAKLAIYNSCIMKEKGTYYGMGDGLPYTSVIHLKRPDGYKMEIVGLFTMCLDGDKGWMTGEKGVMDMTKEQVDLERFNNKAGWIMSLVPLKDKAYAVKADGTAKVGDMMTNVVKVSSKDHPSVTLYFDAKSSHLVKGKFMTKSSEQKGKEVLAEYYFSDFKTVDGATMPHRFVLKHDDKLYVEADVTEMKAAKHDAKTFAKPASN